MLSSLTYLIERMRLNLGKLMLHVVRVHGSDLFSGWSPENLDDLDELIDTRLSWEERLTQHQLGHHATSRPDICKSARQLD